MSRFIKYRRLRRILTYKPTERNLKEGLGLDGRTILQCILKKSVSIREIGLIQLRIGIVGESLRMRY
jgi:hypothetical protein